MNQNLAGRLLCGQHCMNNPELIEAFEKAFSVYISGFAKFLPSEKGLFQPQSSFFHV